MPAKEQPGEQNAAPQGGSPSNAFVLMDGPAAAAPDMAAMVKRLNEAAEYFEQSQHKARWDYTIEKEKDIANSLHQAAALIEKLGQGWIPIGVSWNGMLGHVLALSRDGRISIEEDGNIRMLWRTRELNEDCYFSHWMPLPPPPERP